MKRKRRGRLAVMVLSILLLGGGVVWFAVHNLGAADQIASVAGFVVGLAGLAWSIRGSRAGREQATGNVYIRDSTGIVNGDNAKLTFNIDQRRSKRRR